MAMPVPGGTTLNRLNACFPHFRNTLTFVVALHFQAYVFFKCLIITKTIDGHRVVNDQVDR